MSTKFDRNAKITRVLFIAITALLTFIGLGIFALQQLLFFMAAPRPSAETSGKIYVTREARQFGRRGREAAQCSIIYSVNGKEYSSSTACVGFSNGADVTVLYSPNDPSDAVPDSRRVGYWFGFPGLIFGLITYLLIRSFKQKLSEEKISTQRLEDAEL